MYSKAIEKCSQKIHNVKPIIEKWINVTFAPTGVVILSMFFGILSYYGFKNFNGEILYSILGNPIVRLATLNCSLCLFMAMLFHPKTKVMEWISLVLMGLFTLMTLKGVIELIPNPF